MTESTARAETPSAMQAAAYSSRGTARDKVTLPTDVFDGTINMPVMHQAVNAYLANQRQGNAATKIRKFVVGGNQKPWKQKGTGHARQGSIRAPHWVGGGTVFGPIPRSYAQYVPRQVRALARRSALNARASAGAVHVIDAFQFDHPHTRRIQALLNALDIAGANVLILTDGVKQNVVLSGRNIPSVEVLPFTDASTYHVLWSDVVLIESAALGQPMTPLVEAEPATRERPDRPARAPRPAPGATPKRRAKAKARKSSAKKKPAAKKAATKKRSAAKKKGGKK
jgi:large subunit ribosomal protein L4